jgi:HD superfamily phosphohydrolase
MNEWYSLVCKYKLEHKLTWPQFALQLGVNERGLRRKDHAPSARIVAKLRELFRDQPMPEKIQIQSTIFVGEHPEIEVSRGTRSKKASIQEAETKMIDKSGQSIRAGAKSESESILSDDEAKRLLIPHEYIRDPIHQDILITALERELVDTAAFQRLRTLKQLGPTDLVYPGAVHTRFLHSIGTLHWAEQLVEIVNRNYDTYRQPHLMNIGNYQHLLIRTCALLHDLVHMPFGHTLEDEGNIRESQWKDDRRVELWLGNENQSESTIVKQIKSFLQKSGVLESKATAFVEDIRRYIVPPKKTEKSDYPMNLEYPFIVDIVGNTLCADLLDYLDRDMYFCGLRERSGDRVVKYLAIVRVHRLQSTDGQRERFEQTSDGSLGKGRMVLLTYRIEREHSPEGGSKTVQKSEIKSEAIDLLRRRYALAEKVYFHRTKIAASAMLISATASASLNWEEIFNISDEAFLSKLEASTDPRTRQLIAKYKARQLYRVLYEIRYRPRRDEDEESLDLYDKLYPDYRKPSWRAAAEKEIEEIAGFRDGSVVIYCPALGMNLKQFEMLVQNHPGDEIKPLKDILDQTRQKEMGAINERFEQLWKLLILIDPDVLDVSTPSDKLSDVNKICEEVMRFSNERTDLVLKGQGRSTDDQIARRVIREYQEKHAGLIVPHNMFDKLVTASRRAERTGRIDQCRKNLEALMKSPE